MLAICGYGHFHYLLAASHWLFDSLLVDSDMNAGSRFDLNGRTRVGATLIHTCGWAFVRGLQIPGVRPPSRGISPRFTGFSGTNSDGLVLALASGRLVQVPIPSKQVARRTDGEVIPPRRPLTSVWTPNRSGRAGSRNQVPADEFVWDLNLAVLMGNTCVSVTLMVDMGIS